VARARHHRQVAAVGQVAEQRFVELAHLDVRAADDEQDGRAHVREQRTGQVGPAAARHHRQDAAGALARGRQRGGRSGARAEQAARQPPRRLAAAVEPVDGHGQPPREQRDIEAQLAGERVPVFLVGREQVEQQRAEARLVQAGRHRLVPRRVPGTAAAVGEQHEPGRVVRNGQVAWQRHASALDRHLPARSRHDPDLSIRAAVMRGRVIRRPRAYGWPAVPGSMAP
jgi:hypothetical protein